jgi:transposase
MPRMVLCLEHRVKVQLRRMRNTTADKGLFMRCQIVLGAAKGRSRKEVADGVGCSVSWVDRVLGRWRELGVAGLADRREDNGQLKLDEAYLGRLYEIVDDCPRDYGYPRPTWTTELLAKVMQQETGVKIHRATMSLALKRIGARLGRPKPTVGCPWPKRRRNRCISAIEKVVATLGPREVAVYLDEVDIHLNPKIGPDWMNRGKQKEVMTPGQNVKRYIAGALDASSGQLIWAQSDRKNSLLVIALLNKLLATYPRAQAIHIVLDNFKIHDSQATRAAVAALKGKVVLHFLPPYCPDHNRIERTWRDLHDNVTRNHKCRSMEELMREVVDYIRRRNKAAREQQKRAAA